MVFEDKKIIPSYICFNDESGEWSDKKELFYVRASVIVDATLIKKIEQEISEIRNRNGLNHVACEIKWYDLWLLRRHFKQNAPPKDKRLSQIYRFLRNKNKDYHMLIDYCSDILSLLSNYNLKIIATFSRKDIQIQEKDIIKFHIQDHLQRIQMQCGESIVFIVYDSVSKEKQEIFKEIHKSFIINGDFVKYKSISETLLFDHSYDNNLLQLVDFVAGAIRNTLVSISKNDKNNYEKAKEFFKKYIYPKLARDKNGVLWGAGLKETPKNDSYRDKMKQSLETMIGV